MPGQIETLYGMFGTLNIEANKKQMLQERYLTVLKEFKKRACILSILFYGMRVSITVGSILVPAFISIQGTNIQLELYWTTWMISIVVTICNGIIALFKIDKKYFFIHTTLELLHSEGWQYIGLCGRYSIPINNESPTHENQFLIFFQMAEKIKMRQVEEEYWKFTDTAGIGNATANQRSLSQSSTPKLTQMQLPHMQLPPIDQANTWVGGVTKSVKVKPILETEGTHAP